MKAGVIGFPVHHSKSPIIHGHWMDKYDITGSYKTIEIHPDNFQNEVNELVTNNYNGFNVTAPYKEEILSLCYEIDDIAKAIGAVNTILIEDRKLLGKNTDSFGFIQNIKSQINFNFKNKKCFVIGAGGAARAIIYGLLNEGIQEIYLTNRTKEKAESLRKFDEDKIKIINWEEKENYIGNIDILVNTTSLGMLGKRNLEINISSLNKTTVVTDLVYAPLMTPLLLDAKNQGNDIVTGIGMLLHQARPAFEAWTGILPEVSKTLEEKILK